MGTMTFQLPAGLAPEELQAAFPGAFPGGLAGPSRFLGGETIDELFDRVLPALYRGSQPA